MSTRLRPLPLVLWSSYAVIFAAVISTTSAASAADKEQPDAAPVLLSTKGAEAGWKNIAALEKAAADNNAKACYDLALLALDGSAPEVKKDPARAVDLYERAAKAGLADAWFRLGKMFSDGVGVKIDRTRAFHYYLHGARAGVPEAQFNVGADLVSGRGVKRDMVEGLAWLIVARKSGAPAEGEMKVRERLQKRPGDIARAEMRAEVLLADPFSDAASLAQLRPPTPPANPPEVVAPVGGAADKPAAKIAAPKIDIAPPKLDLPFPAPEPKR